MSKKSTCDVEMEWREWHVCLVSVPSSVHHLPFLNDVMQVFYRIQRVRMFSEEWFVIDRCGVQATDAPKLKTLSDAKQWCRRDWMEHREEYLVEMEGERITASILTWHREPFSKSWEDLDHNYLLDPTSKGWRIYFKDERIGWAKSLNMARRMAERHVQSKMK